MTKWLGLIVLMVAPVLPPVAAQADQPPVAAAFAAVMQDAGHRQTVLDAAKQSPAWTHKSCAGASFAETPEVAVYVPVTFDKNGVPTAGAWREGVVASGCGAPITLNILTKITAPATLATGFLLPGATIADPVLQNYAQKYAVSAAGGIPAGCHDAYVADTEFAGYENSTAGATNATSGPWKEIWMLDLCGSRKRVVLHFIPDAMGITINANPSETTPG